MQGAILLHAIVIGAVFGWALIANHGKFWGENSDVSGAIQATMVASLPLPQKQPVNPDNVLASEKPSPAPPETKEKAAPIPDPKALAIPEKSTKPTKVTDKPQPATPHPQPVKPQPDKATSGEHPASASRCPAHRLRPAPSASAPPIHPSASATLTTFDNSPRR